MKRHDTNILKPGFKIEIKTDLTLDLLDGTYKPYKKSNDQLLYVNASLNHPPRIIKQLPR